LAFSNISEQKFMVSPARPLNQSHGVIRCMGFPFVEWYRRSFRSANGINYRR
jgi:hypothetical protein